MRSHDVPSAVRHAARCRRAAPIAFSIAALRAEGASVIHGADSARISYPEFFDVLERITER